MLASFRVANHRSIRDEQELLLAAGPDPARPVAAIYGANASGKSNLLDALRWMQSAVRGSDAAWEPEGGVPRVPFRLDPLAAAEPSLYAVELLTGGVRHSYGFVVDDRRVLAEWLHAYPRHRKRVIFNRDGDRIRLGSTLPDHRGRSAVLSGLTRDNALLLSVAARHDQAELVPMWRWFQSGLRVGGADLRRVLALLAGGDPVRGRLVALLRAADLGITDIVVDPLDTAAEVEGRLHAAQQAVDGARTALQAAREEVDLVVRSSPGPGEGDALDRTRDALAEAMSAYEERGGELREAEHQLTALEALRARARTAQPTILFHQGQRGATLTVEEQSTGTRRWLSLAAEALSTLDHGGLFAVDEAETSVHPWLTARLISLFRDAETNPGGAQLILTTHHERLLDEETLARDEVWFVEKDADTGETRLFPLASQRKEFQP